MAWTIVLTMNSRQFVATPLGDGHAWLELGADRRRQRQLTFDRKADAVAYARTMPNSAPDKPGAIDVRPASFPC